MYQSEMYIDISLVPNYSRYRASILGLTDMKLYHNIRGIIRIKYLFVVFRLDLLGIVMGTQGPWYAWMYYSFYCDTTLRVSILTTELLYSSSDGHARFCKKNRLSCVGLYRYLGRGMYLYFGRWLLFAVKRRLFYSTWVMSIHRLSYRTTEV